ncbi:hypothetical protein H0E87_022980, partial [Populus deltoides]
MEEERKGVQDEIDKEKRVSPVLEVKVYFGDLDQLDQHVAVALDGEEENETKKQEYCSVIDVSTVKDPEQVMAMVVEKKEKITKIIIQVSVSPPAIVMDVEEEEKDKVEEEDDDDDDEIKKKGWVVLDDGWDSDRVVEDPEEYTRCLRYEPKGRRDLLLYYNKFASESKGFDIDCPPPPGYCWAYPMDLNDSSQLEAVNRMAKFSVEYYNTKYKEKGKMIEFVLVHHANFCRSLHGVYYITLLAKDLIKDDGDEITYQAKEEEEEKTERKYWVVELDDGWDVYHVVGGEPDEYTRRLKYLEKEERDLLGFDLVRPPPPGYCWASPIDINDSSQLGVVNRMARFAVEYYNKKYKRKMEFVRVHHANITRACRDAYYITLLAKDLIKEDDDEEKAYQTK